MLSIFHRKIDTIRFRRKGCLHTCNDFPISWSRSRKVGRNVWLFRSCNGQIRTWFTGNYIQCRIRTIELLILHSSPKKAQNKLGHRNLRCVSPYLVKYDSLCLSVCLCVRVCVMEKLKCQGSSRKSASMTFAQWISAHWVGCTCLEYTKNSYGYH